MLIIVHHRNLHPVAQRLLDHEAFGCLDILKVDPAKAGFHQRNGFDDLVRIFGIKFDIDRIDIGKALEQHRLAFHHRL